MLYCEKCRSACPDSTEKCPNCKNSRLRAVNEEDMVFLHRADQYTAGRLAEQFDEAEIRYQIEPINKGGAGYLYDCELMPTDKNIYVRYEDLPAAKEFSARMKAELEQQNGEEEFAEMPRTKRIVVQVLSLMGFFLLVILAVFGADALAEWLKGLF